MQIPPEFHHSSLYKLKNKFQLHKKNIKKQNKQNKQQNHQDVLNIPE